MRRLTSLALVLFVLGTGDLRAQIEKKLSEVTETKRLVSRVLRPLISTSYPGHGSFRAEYEVQPKRDTTWRLSLFGFASDTTRMSAVDVVRFRADGDTIRSQRVSASTRSFDQRVVEVKHVSLSRSDFQRLATATDVQADVGPFRFILTHPLRKDLRSILRRVPLTQATRPVASEDSASGQ